MSKICNSKLQSEDLVNIEKNKMFTNCNFKVNYTPIKALEETIIKRNQQLQYMGEENLGMGCSKRKAKFLCYCKDPKKRLEMKRKNFIQKLKNIYKIDVEDFNENVINEIIWKVRLLEKERRERRERNVDRRETIINRLLKGQKYTFRETKVESFLPKAKKRVSRRESVCYDKEKAKETKSKLKKIMKNYPQNQDTNDKDLYNAFTLSEKTEEEQRGEEEEEREEKPLTCLEIIKRKKKNLPEILTKKPLDCITFEKKLECTPQKIVFKDYEKGKVYLQNLKITNIGLDTIHCRYLGIMVHTKGERKFPIGVAVRDNVILRPGLTCSTKIRLCSPDDTKEMECSIVYETRRPNSNDLSETSLFFVLVSCIPAQAVVNVTPTKITFPILTWFAATAPENAKLLTKVLKIENVGGKACSCKISDKASSRKSTLGEELNEYEGEESVNLFSATNKSETSQETTNTSDENTKKEIYGEDHFLSGDDAEEPAKLLVNELIENVFSTFRFSKKYCIEIPPFSVQQIEVRFIPKYKGFHHTMKYIQFEGCDNLKEESLELIGVIKQLPIKIEPPVIDLKICMINSGVYADVFRVYNCSKVPYYVRIKTPPSLRKHVHVQPRTTFIQPNGSCTFSVRIYPRVTLSQDAPQYFDESSGVLQFPIRVHPAKNSDCTKDYVELYVHALITTYDLELSPSYINFGLVTTLETLRTKVALTNHSLAIQEYAFLNLPKGTRVEPNMGFGCILPKETIMLDLMYSPVADLCEMGRGVKDVEFDVMVTSIAQCGGFREKLKEEESNEESDLKSDDFEYGVPNSTAESYTGNSKDRPFQGESKESEANEESSDSDFCDDFSTDGEEFTSKLQIRENKIRKFLRSEDETPKQVEESQEDSQETLPVIVENEEVDSIRNSSRAAPNFIKCRATVVIPRCHLSETVIQLPATPFQCFSLYRLKLRGLSDTGCMCGLKSGVRMKFRAIFEFVYSHEQIMLEPGSGYLREGDSVPLTVIFRPEVGEDRLEGRNSKPSDAFKERYSKKDSILSRSNTSKRHSSQKKGRKRTEDTSFSEAMDFRFSAPSQHRKTDSFAEDKSSVESDEPFSFETKVRCIIKSLPCENDLEITEVHDIVFICPAIRREFNYLGNSEEINFGTIPVGTRSQIILQFQNTSSERLCPSLSLLNPAGPFICPAIFNVEIDPEHIWRQPLTFAPEKVRAEDQFFDINFGHTNILLKVSGDAMEPKYDIRPTFECCLLEAKPGTTEEIKLEIMNHSPLELLFQLEGGFITEGFDLTVDVETDASESEPREGSNEKKKTKYGENDKKKTRLWGTIPEEIRNSLRNFEKCAKTNIFVVVGVDGENNFVIPPNEMNQIKIQFWAPAERSDKKYAIRYNLKMGRRVPCKEMIILGKVLN